MDYRYASLTNQGNEELKRLEQKFRRDTGKNLILIAYEQNAVPTPVFNDIQLSGTPELKQNTFQSHDSLFGSIEQWHI